MGLGAGGNSPPEGYRYQRAAFATTRPNVPYLTGLRSGARSQSHQNAKAETALGLQRLESTNWHDLGKLSEPIISLPVCDAPTGLPLSTSSQNAGNRKIE